MKTVKIGRLGQEIREFALDDTTDVAGLLSAAGVCLNPGESVRIGGLPVGQRHVPNNGDLILIVPNIKGG